MHTARQAEALGYSRQRGATLVELLVTLTIFAFVTLVLTTSFVTMLNARNQTEVSQQLGDELRLALDTMETEINGATDFSTVGYCGSGTCTGIEFTVSTRPDLVPYRVIYRLNALTGRLEKGMQRTDGECSTLPLPAECFLPVTSPDTEVEHINFDVFVSGASAQRPVITVSLEVQTEADDGEVVPLSVSSTFTPRTLQEITDIDVPVDVTRPSVIFNSIEPSDPSSGCGLYRSYDFVSEVFADPWDNNLPWVADQNIPGDGANDVVYTDCTEVDLSFDGVDADSGISGGRYDGDTLVDGGLCYGMACSGMNPGVNGTYALPVGVSPGSTRVTFEYQDIPLHKGSGRNGYEQHLYMRVKDMNNNPNNPAAYVRIMQVSAPDPPPAIILVKYIQLWCHNASAGQWSSLIEIRPVMPSQYYMRWYRCTMTDVTDPLCDPLTDSSSIVSSDFRFNPVSNEWHYVVSGAPVTSTDYVTHNYGWSDVAGPHMDRDTLYRYAFTLFDPLTGLESGSTILFWQQNYPGASGLDGSAPGDMTNTIGLVPDDWCRPTPPQCNNGIDDDGDGFIDYGSPFDPLVNDPHCDNFSDNMERAEQCRDGIDNADPEDLFADWDGAGMGPVDPGCDGGPLDDNETEEECRNGIDDDGDGTIDHSSINPGNPDPGCSSDLDNLERDPQCRDGDDNDSDGLIDYGSDYWTNDPGCTSLNDDNESNSILPQCSNRVDDADPEDILADFPTDPGCVGPTDNNETDPQCRNGLDDDGDGMIDHSSINPGNPDPGCDNENDNDETDPVLDTINVTVNGVWTANVTQGGGFVLTNPVFLSMGGNAATTDVQIDNIDGSPAAVYGVTRTLSGCLGAAAPCSPNVQVKLQVPANMTPGTYNVTLIITSANAPTEYHVIPLIAELDTGGEQ